MGKGIGIVATIVGLILASAAHAYDPGAWRDDYQALKTGMEASYANLAWFGSPDGGLDLPALDRSTEAALAAAASDAQSEAAIRAFIKAFPDGHLEWVSGQSSGPVRQERSSALDLSGDPASGCASLGYETPRNAGFSLPFQDLPTVAAMADRPNATYDIALAETAAGRVALVRIPSFWMKHYPDLCRAAWIAGRREPPPKPEDLERRLDKMLAARLAADLRRLPALGVVAVMVDLGGNGGGDESGDRLTRLFSATPLRSPALWAVAGAPARIYLADELELLRRAAATASGDNLTRVEASITLHERMAATPMPVCDRSWVWLERRTWSPSGCSGLAPVGADPARPDLPPYDRDWLDKLKGAWTGPVYVLIDGDSASSAEMFPAILRDARRARIVGVRSYGAGCGHVAGPNMIALPHSGLRLSMPDCVRLRADGENEIAGIRPDLPITATLPADRAAQALTLVAKDLADRPPALARPAAAP